MPSFLAVDIGNTTIHAGLFEADQQTTKTHIRILPSEISTALPAWVNQNPDRILGMAIASVNPIHCETFNSLRLSALPTPMQIPDDWPVPIENKTKSPEQVGIDRLLNAYAAYSMTGVASIIIDLGTALTVDVVDMEGCFLGGIIAPGVRASIQALSSSAAGIDCIDLKSQDHVLGQNTLEAVTSGLFHGYQGMIRHFIELLDAEQQVRHELLFTGGDAELIASAMGFADNIVPTLTLNAIHMVAMAHG